MMETIELQLDKQTLERAQQVAVSRRCTLAELITEILEQLGTTRTVNDAFLGMFADEPALIDEVMESAMNAREKHPLRQTTGSFTPLPPDRPTHDDAPSTTCRSSAHKICVGNAHFSAERVIPHR